MRKFALLLALLITPVAAQASTVTSALAGAELRGAATFKFTGFPVYEARLYTKGGAPLDWAKDFGLELKYLRNVSENTLIEGTLREFKRTGGALPLEAQLATCFKDVRKGDRFLAVTNGGNQIGFWHNGKRTCTLKYPQIKTRFMSVFLGNNTRSASFTRQLRGE
ncbi:MAG: chalcone isomerase family protein [Maritimibacter sp.]